MKAILFDAYGTLLDIHSAIDRVNGALGTHAAAISALWRQKQLEYTWTLTLARRYRPFDELTAASLDFALAHFGIEDNALRRELLAAYRHLTPYPEVGAALTRLGERNLRLGILSNGTPDMLRTAFEAHELDDILNPFLSVDSLRLYKPHPDVYAMAARQLSLQPGEIGFVSSNAWDAMGAATFGFRVYWLRRQAAPIEYDLPMQCTQITSVADLADLIPA